jgi:endonuclease III
MLTLLSNRIKLCNSTLEKLQKRLERVPQSLLETHEKLVSILRSISLANTKSKVGKSLHVSEPS